MGLTVRQWRQWRPSRAVLWLQKGSASGRSWQEEQAVVAWHCAAGRAGFVLQRNKDSCNVSVVLVSELCVAVWRRDV
jgi:hypothetical protein